MTFATDISTRIQEDFGTKYQEAIDLIVAARETENFPQSDRITRCLIFVANGSLTGLASAIDIAKTDWRDLIMAAEYEPETSKQIRDFSSPFSAG